MQQQSPDDADGAHASVPRRRLVGARGRRDQRIVAENRLLELPELGAWLDAELLDQLGPSRSIRLQRVGLTARAIEGEHQLGSQPLAERVACDDASQLGDDLFVPAQREVRIEAVGEGAQVKLVEALGFETECRRKPDVTEGRPAPEGERLGEEACGLRRFTGCSRALDQIGEVCKVGLGTFQTKLIPVRARDQSPVRESAAQAHNAVLNDLRRACRRVVPERVDQPID